MSKVTIYEFVAADREMIAAGGGYSFRTYTDRVGVFGNAGAEVYYHDGSKTRDGRPLGKAFSINQSFYKLQARDNQKDYEGKLMYDFFINAPFCEGSPNGEYTDEEGPVILDPKAKRSDILTKLKTGEWKQHNVKIRLMETELDAQLALETGLRRAEAQLSSGAIDEQTLSEIAALIGLFGKPDKTMRHKVYEFAGKRPIDYFSYLNAGDRGIRALVRKGVADGILKQKGTIILWEETILGNDEDAAVATLLGDAQMLKTLKDKINLKVDTKAKKK